MKDRTQRLIDKFSEAGLFSLWQEAEKLQTQIAVTPDNPLQRFVDLLKTSLDTRIEAISKDQPSSSNVDPLGITQRDMQLVCLDLREAANNVHHGTVVGKAVQDTLGSSQELIEVQRKIESLNTRLLDAFLENGFGYHEPEIDAPFDPSLHALGAVVIACKGKMSKSKDALIEQAAQAIKEQQADARICGVVELGFFHNRKVLNKPLVDVIYDLTSP